MTFIHHIVLTQKKSYCHNESYIASLFPKGKKKAKQNNKTTKKQQKTKQKKPLK